MRELKVKNTRWVSLVKPSREELQELERQFSQIHALAMEDLLSPTIRPFVENYETHLYLVLRFPRFLEHEHRTVAYEIDFILFHDTIITVQYDDIPVVENLWHKCENEEPQVQSRYGKTPVHILYYLLRGFFAQSLRELDSIQEKIDVMEEEIFSGREKEILEDIALLKRNVLDFRRAAKPQLITLESLTAKGLEFYGAQFRPFLVDIGNEYLRVWNLLENHKETLDALYETNNSLLATKTNNAVLAFTILAFISFIPTAVANIYGMNIALPLADRENAFVAVLSIMAMLTLFVFIILKWRKLI